MAVVITQNAKTLEIHRLVRKLSRYENYPAHATNPASVPTSPEFLADSQTLERLKTEVRNELTETLRQEELNRPPEVKNMALEPTSIKDAKKNLNKQYNENIQTYRDLCSQLKAIVEKKKSMREDRVKLDKILKQETLSPEDETFVRQYLA